MQTRHPLACEVRCRVGNTPGFGAYGFRAHQLEYSVLMAYKYRDAGGLLCSMWPEAQTFCCAGRVPKSTPTHNTQHAAAAFTAVAVTQATPRPAAPAKTAVTATTSPPAILHTAGNMAGAPVGSRFGQPSPTPSHHATSPHTPHLPPTHPAPPNTHTHTPEGP